MKTTIDKYVEYVLVALMSLMTLDVLWGVFTRYAMGSQASWSEELARFLLIWIGILGAAYASGQKMHLSIDLLKSKLSLTNQRRMPFVINSLIILFVFCIMIVGGLRLIYITNVLGQISPALRIPMYTVYGIIPISGILIIYYKVNDLAGTQLNNRK